MCGETPGEKLWQICWASWICSPLGPSGEKQKAKPRVWERGSRENTGAPGAFLSVVCSAATGCLSRWFQASLKVGSSRTAIPEHSGAGCSRLRYTLGSLHVSQLSAPGGSCAASLVPQPHSALTDTSLVHSLLNLSLDGCFRLPGVPSRSWRCPGGAAEGPSPGLADPATKHNGLKPGCCRPQTHFVLP